jgi:hypothetical protein
MSAPSTLYSKLKILVAKLYKAEKLYSSMKRIPLPEVNNKPVSPTRTSGSVKPLSNLYNSQSNFQRKSSKVSDFENRTFGNSKDSHVNEINRNSTNNSLIEHANDVRSCEWHKIHQSFRIRLNDLLSEGNNYLLSQKFNDLWLEFLAEFEIAELDLQECNESAKDALNKEEYSYLIKLSSELIKRKAKLQALKVIHDELNGLLTTTNSKNKVNYSSLNDILAQSEINSDNVIPLRRKAAN